MLLDLLSTGMFRLCHGSQLVYNTCWEDPRLDRIALKIGGCDEVMVITSGGCNTLDYLLDEPRRIYAVDVNPRQNALLELKLAGIRALDYDTFFACSAADISRTGIALIPHGSASSFPTAHCAAYWDVKGWMFRSRRRRRSFYFHGSSGMFAWLVNLYVDRVAKVRDAVDALFDASTLEEQRDVYYSRIKPVFWGRMIQWLTRRDFALAMLGVPRSQRRQIESCFPAAWPHSCNRVEDLLTNISLGDNYFWRVYVNGEYTRECCPEYLKAESFARLKQGLVDRVEIHTNTVEGFLHQCDRGHLAIRVAGPHGLVVRAAPPFAGTRMAGHCGSSGPRDSDHLAQCGTAG